jgi:secreted trypsin-like serine protease
MLSNNNESNAFEGKLLRFCGMGSTQNYPTFPATLKCADLRVVPSHQCGVNLTNILCTFWKDRDNNVCSGDYGGPLYEVTENGTNKIQTLVGIASFSPNARKNASCLGGHKVVFTRVSAYLPIIEEFIGTTLKSFSIRGRNHNT